jgi:hypothetical protein
MATTKLDKAAQRLPLAEAALALARDRMDGSASRRSGLRTLLLGAVAAALAAALFWKRETVAKLLPSGAGEPSEPAPPAPSNYDASGPPANTATPVPAPDPATLEPIDERAEEAAAGAEAASIGGVVSDYAGPEDLPADEAERPLAEAGEGVAEGQEQAEAALAEAAEPTAPGVSDAERQVEDAIEAAANPTVGETVEPLEPATEPAAAETEAETAAPGDEGVTEDAAVPGDEGGASDEAETKTPKRRSRSKG